MEEEVFRALIQRVRSDRQVSYVWWLYNRYMTDGNPRDRGDSLAPPTTSTT